MHKINAHVISLKKQSMFLSYILKIFVLKNSFNLQVVNYFISYFCFWFYDVIMFKFIENFFYGINFVLQHYVLGVYI